MLKNRFPVLCALPLLSVTALAQEGLGGEWLLHLDPEGSEPIIGMLELSRTDGNWVGFVEGGPVEASVEGEEVEVLVDSRNLQGFVFYRRLRGKLDNDELSGTFSVEGDVKPLPPGGTWSGVRPAPDKPRARPDPVNLSGIWTPAPGIDFRKYSMDLTPAAQEWLDGYMFHYDQPNIRCVSPGIVAMVAWGGYPMEILETDKRLTFLYEVENSVRRIFMDGRPPHKYMPPSAMGYSNGYWDGQTLVIETKLIAANVRDFRGEPVSDDAEMLERYSLSEDGQTLSAVIELHDPVNYKRPPIRRRQWVRNPETEIFPYECDPDSFFRQMYEEGKLKMYFERWDRRL